jgi:hypothetical protein
VAWQTCRGMRCKKRRTSSSRASCPTLEEELASCAPSRSQWGAPQRCQVQYIGWLVVGIGFTANPAGKQKQRSMLESESELNPRVVQADYAVRGDLTVVASQLARQGKGLLHCNIGNPHELGQQVNDLAAGPVACGGRIVAGPLTHLHANVCSQYRGSVVS